MTLDSSADRLMPQIKVCGLTDVEKALGCAHLGAQAIGCVFYPKSPRYVSDRVAADICQALPETIKSVGVFVDENFSAIMKKVERCRLSAVQLHGQEPPELVERLCREDIRVIKALFIHKLPKIDRADAYPAHAFIVEFGHGSLPGGNALAWDWKLARAFSANHPLLLAGGLSADNVGEAVSVCGPDAVDVSSGVESAPGLKDLAKVKTFISAVIRSAKNDVNDMAKRLRKIF